ncbi:MAG: AMP-binding protein [Candidatus Methylomirabilales bacterium]
MVWRPSREYVEGSRLTAFMRRERIPDFGVLCQRAKAEPEWYWDAVVRDLGIEWFTPYTKVLDTSRGIPWARWFVSGRLNLTHNAVDRHLGTPRRDKAAVVWEGEDGQIRALTYAELAAAVNRLANGLRSLGVGRGDTVGIFLPMGPETVIATLACSKIGAVYVPIFSGYGADAAATRLRDSAAKLLITADGFFRRGRTVAMKRIADEAVTLSGCVGRVIVHRRLGTDIPWTPGRDLGWDEAVRDQPTDCASELMASEDPFMLIYTSGTTGRPKATVHVHAGFPLKGTHDMAYCFDVQERDTLFWLTDLGWMMGPWEIMGTLTLGATLCLYDGAIDWPAPDRLWAVVARHRVSVFGISPTAIRALMPHGEAHVKRHDLSSLRILGSTGEPWNPAPWGWFFEQVGGGRCPIINYSGGTEVAGGILGCTPLEPQKPCAFSCVIPGMDADVFDKQGRPVRGQVGELVIKGPWPGMTAGFFQDPERYLETYWSRFPEVWVHGDWAEIDADGFWYIHGRSDDTIKIAGKRVGPAEVESALAAHPAVAESAAIGVPHPVKGEVLACVVMLKPGHEPTEALRRALTDQVTRVLGKALRPEAVRFVKDLPRTRNAKIVRRVVKAKYLDRADLGDLSSLENPEAIDAIARAV